ncbi:MAG: hypothetical protein Q7J85_03375 [Bacillota bacterium]|nr:hypothetical protein [Bacillota bacterium]
MQQKIVCLTRHLLDRRGTQIQDSIFLSWLEMFMRILEEFDLELEVWQEGNGWTKDLPGMFKIHSVPDPSRDLTLPNVNQAMWEHSSEAVFAIYADPLLVYPQSVPVSIALGHYIPSLDLINNEFVEHQRKSWLAKLRQGLSTVDYVIVNHTPYIQWALASFPGVYHKIIHIPDCLHPLSTSDSQIEKQSGENEVRLIFACPALPQFGVSETIRAVDSLIDRFDYLKFYFHGAIPKPLEKQMAGWFDKRPRCFLKTDQPRFQFGDVVVFPVKRGPVPVFLVQQAMACGSAVVGSMWGPLVDLIIHQYNGFFIKPLDEEIYASAARLVRDIELRERICNHALETSKTLKHETWKKRWRTLIFELVGRRSIHI